jgi:hypothetical protein
MNELQKLDQAKQLFNRLETENGKEFQSILKELITCLILILDLAYAEASETEAGRRWYKNLVEKREIALLKAKQINIKNVLKEFDFSLKKKELIEHIKIYLNEIEKIVNSGLDRYISG